MYHSKAQSLLFVLISGLFFLTQALGLPAPNSEPSVAEDIVGLTCTAINSSSSPLTEDCRQALQKIEPVAAGVCITRVYRPVANPAVVGTCTVQTFSEKGKAHCIDGSNIIKGIQAILNGCSSSHLHTEYTQGSYTWTAPSQPSEGVRLIRTENV